MSERDVDSDKSKASFKLDLVETVNADPVMQPTDLSLLVAYLSMMSWPTCKSWLSTSRARAMTSLSERQIVTSRQRLQERGYMIEEGTIQGTSKLFRITNPRRDDMRQHVAIMTDDYREKQATRQAERRRRSRPVPANSAETEEAMSQSPGECDVSANSAGYYPSYTPQDLALKEGTSINLRASSSAAGRANAKNPRHLAFLPPAGLNEAEEMVMSMLSGQPRSVTLTAFDELRDRLLAGTLTPAQVDQLLKSAAA